MKKAVPSSHDRFFRAALSDTRVAKEFFEFHLPPVIKDVVNLNHLKLLKDSYVDEHLKLSLTDMLFETEFLGHPGYLYTLVEHQSTPDILMAFRLLKYLIAIMDQHLKTTQGTKLPLIYPLIFYTGETKYPYSTDIFDLFDQPNHLAREIFLKPFQLVAVSQIPDEELKKRVWSGIMELSMKHIWARDILPYLKNMLELLKEAEHSGGVGYVQSALTYLFTTGEVKDKELFIEIIQTGLSPETREAVMTIAEQFKAEGIEKGMQQGIERGRQEGISEGQLQAKKSIAQNLLDGGIPIEVVSHATGLSIQEVRLLSGTKSH